MFLFSLLFQTFTTPLPQNQGKYQTMTKWKANSRATVRYNNLSQ